MPDPVATACYGAPLYVEHPATRPLPYGLFSVSEILTPGDPHWQQGVEWEPVGGCDPAGVYACPTCAQNDGDTAPAKTYEEGVHLVQAFPFTVYGSFKCSPMGGRWEDGQQRALWALENGRERAVEAQFALGTHQTTNALVRSTTVDITPTPGTPVTVQQGLALLEQYGAANSHGQFVISGARRDILLANTTGELIEPSEDGTHLETVLGTPVAALSGFNGRTGPNGTAAGTTNAWLFAHGRPVIRKSEAFMVPPSRDNALNTQTNDLEFLAEQTFSIGWECFTAAVLITSIGTA